MRKKTRGNIFATFVGLSTVQPLFNHCQNTFPPTYVTLNDALLNLSKCAISRDTVYHEQQ